jgi:hypothetical protein
MPPTCPEQSTAPIKQSIESGPISFTLSEPCNVTGLLGADVV